MDFGEFLPAQQPSALARTAKLVHAMLVLVNENVLPADVADPDDWRAELVGPGPIVSAETRHRRSPYPVLAAPQGLH